MSDEFQPWRDRLAGKRKDVDINTPEPGFYRMRAGKDGPWMPVAIWTKDGQLVCRVGATMRDPAEVWSWCKPVEKDAAKAAFETGKWPGDIDIGHNSGDLTLAEQIADTAEQAEAFLRQPISDDVRRDMGQNYRTKLTELGGRYDKEREAKIQPHLEAQRQINAEYKPVIDRAKDIAARLRVVVGKYMAEQEDKLRKEAEARAAAENARIAAEHAAAAKAAEVSAANEPPPAPTFVAPAEVKVQAGGQRGKKAGLKTQKVYSIDDYAATLAHVKDHADVVAAVQKVAFQQARAGATVPGVKVTEERVAT